MLTEQEIIRREKLEKLKQMGINPYPAELFPVDFTAKEVIDSFEDGKEVVMAGRIMSLRIQGKASFAELQDSTDRVQLYVNRDELCPGQDKSLYNDFFKKLIDMGDIVGVKGHLFITQKGEKTVMVKDMKMLSKALRPLPLPKVDAQGVVHDQFNDIEQRYRMRYVDLIVNPGVKEIFVKRTKLFNAMREFFNQRGYMEVETPVLQSIPGGAAARPFVTKHNALDIPLYMRIANELYLKRLIVGGFDGVYEFSKNFRNEGMDRTHNPEFTAMEIYIAYKDYIWLMDFTEKLLEYCAMQVNGTTQVEFCGHMVDFKAPYKRITMRDAIEKYTGFDIEGKSEEQIREFAMSIGIEVNPSMGKGKLIDEIFGEKCEKNFIEPTFITDYPKEMSPLTKQHRNNPNLTERFELMICGKEVANAYSELNDPIDQRERFEHQMELSKKGDDEAMFIDQDFLRALEYGMPPTGGIGIGMDRLIMFLTNNQAIQEVLFFPQMRPEKKTVELSQEEKIIFKEIKEIKEMPLDELKEKAGLSNKKWDTAIKGLSAKKIVKVEKKDEKLFVRVLQ